jgi:uncharacterized delta-60 repeat protein
LLRNLAPDFGQYTSERTNNGGSHAMSASKRATSKARKITLLLFSVAVLLASGTAAARGQSALDGFDPNANGTVWVVVVQPDGKILIGGDFTSLSPNGGASVTRNRIARLNPDGTLDTAFNPNANSSVYSIAVQADGQVLAGGAFTAIGGQPRNRIARLDATTGLADSFDPNADAAVDAIAMQSDGKILVGGSFTGAISIGGQPRHFIARLDATTGLADSFDPNANNFVYSISVQTDGEILAGGNFTSLSPNGGAAVTRNHIARLNPDGTLDTAFNPNANDRILSIAVQADGKVLAGGDFNGANSIGGQARNRIARLNATTGAADAFNPNANNTVAAITVQADGNILVGGAFTGANSIGGQTRNYIARLNAATGAADAFNPNAGGTGLVESIAVQADGRVLAGGQFTTFAPSGGATVTRNRIARLEKDGRLDQTLDLGIVGNYVEATVVQQDGKILIGGLFSTVLGVTRNYIARLNTDGTLDTAFNPNANSTVTAIAVQADGKILVGGVFSGVNSIGGQMRNRIARLDPVTGLADSFDPNANSTVEAIAVQADGKILAGGDFTSLAPNGGVPATRNRIARLNPDGTLDTAFDPNANNPVDTIAVQADGKILAGGSFSGVNSIGGQTRNFIARLDAVTGFADSFDPNANSTVGAIVVQPDGKVLAGSNFTTIGGQTRNHIARLDPVTGLADSLDPNANGNVLSIAVQADGKILAGGLFNSIGGQTRNYIARLDATTGLADSFDPNSNGVYSIAVQADGKILAGGPFTSIGGQTRNHFARLNNDTIAVQNLAVMQTNVNWTLGGSSPQFGRVTFEDSTDNVNYNFLGNGTASGSNWTLTGLNLSIGQNLYIRARGYYRTGYLNGSESITESVRNAFISPLPTPTSVVSRKTHGGAGDFFVNLPLTGTPGIECRTGGSTNDFTIVATFPGNVTVTGNPQAQVTSGTAAVGSGGVSNGGMVTVSGNTVTIPLTNVANAQTINVTLNSVNGSTNVVIPMSVLAGDTTANGSVNSSDIAQTQSQSGQTVTSSNFREDVTVNGSVNSSDIAFVQSKSGTALPVAASQSQEDPITTTPKHRGSPEKSF